MSGDRMETTRFRGLLVAARLASCATKISEAPRHAADIDLPVNPLADSSSRDNRIQFQLSDSGLFIFNGDPRTAGGMFACLMSDAPRSGHAVRGSRNDPRKVEDVVEVPAESCYALPASAPSGAVEPDVRGRGRGIRA